MSPRHGTKWIGLLPGLVQFDDANWTIYNTSNSGLPNDYVVSMATDNNGTMWFGTLGGGLVNFDGTSWVVYNTTNSGLADDNVVSLAIDNNDTKWIGTWNSSLARFDGTTWTVFNTANSGLPANPLQDQQRY